MENEGKQTKSNRVIKLQDLIKRGVHIEKIAEMENSLYQGIYERAFESVGKIVEFNRTYTDNKRCGIENPVTEISNVVSFIGRRGTGKTSAMMTFSNALDRFSKDKDWYSDENKGKCYVRKDLQGVHFHVLNYIDASILEDSEDIVILVLANMMEYLQKYRETGSQEGMRTLTRKFEKVYKDFCALRDSEQYKNRDYSTYEQLMGVVKSQNVRKELRDLVECILQYINANDCRYAEGYIVVTIDDLDMAYYNINMTKKTSKINNKSYEIVNSIHKYLSLPGVILLTSYNYQNLLLQSANFFASCDNYHNYDPEEKAIYKKKSTKLANEFEEKVFPMEYRLYLPSWKKSDFNETRCKVEVGELDDKSIFTKYGDHILTVKRLILYLYAEKLGIYYDVAGTKTHFLEPDSIRQMSELISLFQAKDCQVWEKYPENAEDTYKDMVFNRIKSDAYFRFVEERIYQPAEKEFFRELMERRIDRRSEEIVKKYCKYIDRLGLKAKQILNEEKSRYDLSIEYRVMGRKETDIRADEEMKRALDNSNVSYSVAELVHVIYHMTREENLASRELVDSILQTYTIHLSDTYREYHKLKFSDDKFYKYLEKEYGPKKIRDQYSNDDAINSVKDDPGYLRLLEQYRVLRGVIGKTVCGRWAEYFMPRLYYKINDGTPSVRKPEPITMGYVGTLEFQYSCRAIDITHLEGKEFENIIKELVFVLFMYNDVIAWSDLKMKLLDSEKEIQISFSTDKEHSFEPTAIFKNSFLYIECLEKIEQLILNAIDTEKKNLSTEKDDKRRRGRLEYVAREIPYVFEKIWNEFSLWDKEYGTMMLPVHNFDLFYNLLKRMYQKSDVIVTETIALGREKEFVDVVIGIMELFIKQLEYVDTFYKIKESRYSFIKKIVENPIYKWILQFGEKERKNITKFAINIVTSRTSVQTRREAPNER